MKQPKPSKMQEALDIAAERIENLVAENAELENENYRLAEENSDFAGRVDELNTTIDELQDEIDSLNSGDTTEGEGGVSNRVLLEVIQVLLPSTK